MRQIKFVAQALPMMIVESKHLCSASEINDDNSLHYFSITGFIYIYAKFADHSTASNRTIPLI